MSFEDTETAEKTASEWGLDLSKLTKVDFIPKDEDSRYVDLAPEEYDKIEEYLSQIEVGELTA